MSLEELRAWWDWVTRHELPSPDEDAAPDGFRACAAAGARALHHWYDPATGLWRKAGWWNSANALNAVIQYTQRTGDTEYRALIEKTFSAAPRTYASFINDYYDDNGWWALSWIAAFDLTGDQRYLEAAKVIFAEMTTGWDDKCGGGIWWTRARTYKNAIPNELFLLVAGRLHQRAQSDGTQIGSGGSYLDWAQREWSWFKGSGLIGAAGLVNDGLTSACKNNGGPTWTYNQGVILGGLAVLHEITGEADLLDHGNKIADAAIRGLTSPAPPAGAAAGAAPGMLIEPCERSAEGCNGDQALFKGIFVRNLYDFYLRSRRDDYRAFILANAHSIWGKNRNYKNQFGLCWGGPFDRADASRQTSALDVLNAAVALSAHNQPSPA